LSTWLWRLGLFWSALVWSRVSFAVWDEAMTSVVRVLVAGEWLEAGRYAMWWDGLSDGGEALPEGTYP
jgi:hypothetical protein